MLARASKLANVLNEYGVTIVPNHVVRSPRQTHAGQTLQKLWKRFGEDHVRDVLTCILESENNALALINPIIVATSRLLLAHERWWQLDASTWLEVFDRVNLVELHEAAKANRRAAAPADAIAQELYRRLAERFDQPAPSLFSEPAST